ncbi:MAG: YfcE family phosphodiesterase [Thermoprotei archaeon]|nr:MAG: YfcE family phosphodiesterase [Thermoprotei archaeon]
MRMEILVIGDTHVPDRAEEIPKNIRRYIESRSFDAVVSTGDLTGREILEYLQSLGSELHVVQGNMDWLPLPEHEILELPTNPPTRCGVIHGDQVYPRGNVRQLYMIAQDLGVRVLISGHTHKPSTKLFQGVLLLNPGSATGAPSGAGAPAAPSFIVLRVESECFEVRLFTLENDVLRTRTLRIPLERLGVKA